ncbi:MAG: hypothetical protein PVI91_10945 [Gammaproteobacteria bacterium]
MIDPELLRRLRALVGQRVDYSGHSCRIVEVLDTEHALVIRCEGKERVIQGNQFGEANRRVQEYYTLPLFDDGAHLNPLIRHWLD